MKEMDWWPWSLTLRLICYRIFEKVPGSFGKFGSLFGGASPQKAAGSDGLVAQAQSFAKQMDMWISNLKDMNVCEIQSRRFAKLHKARGVSAQEIQVSALNRSEQDRYMY